MFASLRTLLMLIKSKKSSINDSDNEQMNDGTGSDMLDKQIAIAGYSYDPEQDIFYSNHDAWQGGMGYCRLYDEAAAPFGMIVDCEPIYFLYDNKGWLIELWKGQYDLCTGCEVGIYTAVGPVINILGTPKAFFYNSAGSEDQLQISVCLKKDRKTLLTREDKHWWLTGFKIGDFSTPSELTLDAAITLKEDKMRDTFINALKNIGYLQDEIHVDGNTVSFIFKRPHTKQPYTRTKVTDWIIQEKNKLLCDKYQDITRPFDNLVDKVNAVSVQAPRLYREIITVSRAKQLIWKNKK